MKDTLIKKDCSIEGDEGERRIQENQHYINKCTKKLKIRIHQHNTIHILHLSQSDMCLLYNTALPTKDGSGTTHSYSVGTYCV